MEYSERLLYVTLFLWAFLWVTNFLFPSLNGRVVLRSQALDFVVFCISMATALGSLTTKIIGI